MNMDSVREALLSDRERLREIITLSFPRFFRFFASHSVDSKDGRVLVFEVQSDVAGFAKLIDFKLAVASTAVSSGMPFTPDIVA